MRIVCRSAGAAAPFHGPAGFLGGKCIGKQVKIVDVFLRSALLLEASSEAAQDGIKIPITLLLGFLGVIVLIYGLAEVFNVVYRKKPGPFVPEPPEQGEPDGQPPEPPGETPPVPGGAEQSGTGNPDEKTDK